MPSSRSTVLVLVAIVVVATAGATLALVDGDDPGRRDRPVPVLLYHRVSTTASTVHPALDVRPGDFVAQMRWLKKRGYEAVTLERVYEHWNGDGSLPPRPIVISFDDGYRSVYSEALPVMRSLRWRGVLYLTEGNVGPSWGLSERMVAALARAGWEIDAHTLTHPDLTRVSARRLRREVGQARVALRRRFGLPMNFFAYPLGRYDDRVVAAVRAAGYLDAVTSDYGLATPLDRFRLKRIGIERHDGVSGMITKLRGAFVEFEERRSRR